MFGLPIPIIHYIVTYGIGFLILALFVRIVLSWFRMDERIAFVRFLASITDPFILPIRRIIGRQVMIFDVSFFVALFLLTTLSILLSQSLPGAW